MSDQVEEARAELTKPRYHRIVAPAPSGGWICGDPECLACIALGWKQPPALEWALEQEREALRDGYYIVKHLLDSWEEGVPFGTTLNVIRAAESAMREALASSPGAAAETGTDRKLNLHIWQVDHGWAAAIYTGDGSVPGSLGRAAAAYSSPDEAVADGLDWLKTRLARKAAETESSA